MKTTKSYYIFMVTINKSKNKLFKGNSSNFRKINKFEKTPQQASVSFSKGSKNESFKGICNFYHLFGHRKVDCKKFKARLNKKGIRLLLLSFDSNIVNLSSNT